MKYAPLVEEVFALIWDCVKVKYSGRTISRKSVVNFEEDENFINIE